MINIDMLPWEDSTFIKGQLEDRCPKAFDAHGKRTTQACSIPYEEALVLLLGSIALRMSEIG